MKMCASFSLSLAVALSVSLALSLKAMIMTDENEEWICNVWQKGARACDETVFEVT